MLFRSDVPNLAKAATRVAPRAATLDAATLAVVPADAEALVSVPPVAVPPVSVPPVVALHDAAAPRAAARCAARCAAREVRACRRAAPVGARSAGRRRAFEAPVGRRVRASELVRAACLRRGARRASFVWAVVWVCRAACLSCRDRPARVVARAALRRCAARPRRRWALDGGRGSVVRPRLCCPRRFASRFRRLKAGGRAAVGRRRGACVEALRRAGRRACARRLRSGGRVRCAAA